MITILKKGIAKTKVRSRQCCRSQAQHRLRMQATWGQLSTFQIATRIDSYSIQLLASIEMLYISHSLFI